MAFTNKIEITKDNLETTVKKDRLHLQIQTIIWRLEDVVSRLANLSKIETKDMDPYSYRRWNVFSSNYSSLQDLLRNPGNKSYAVLHLEKNDVDKTHLYDFCYRISYEIINVDGEGHETKGQFNYVKVRDRDNIWSYISKAKCLAETMVNDMGLGSGRRRDGDYMNEIFSDVYTEILVYTAIERGALTAILYYDDDYPIFEANSLMLEFKRGEKALPYSEQDPLSERPAAKADTIRIRMVDEALTIDYIKNGDVVRTVSSKAYEPSYIAFGKIAHDVNIMAGPDPHIKRLMKRSPSDLTMAAAGGTVPLAFLRNGVDRI